MREVVSIFSLCPIKMKKKKHFWVSPPLLLNFYCDWLAHRQSSGNIGISCRKESILSTSLATVDQDNLQLYAGFEWTSGLKCSLSEPHRCRSPAISPANSFVCTHFSPCDSSIFYVYRHPHPAPACGAMWRPCTSEVDEQCFRSPDHNTCYCLTPTDTPHTASGHYYRSSTWAALMPATSFTMSIRVIAPTLDAEQCGHVWNSNKQSAALEPTKL